MIGACQYFCMLGIVGCRLLVVVHHVEGLLTTERSLFGLLSTDPPQSLREPTASRVLPPPLPPLPPKDHRSASWVLPFPIHVRTNRRTVSLLLAHIAYSTCVRTHPEGRSISSDNCYLLKVSDFNGSLWDINFLGPKTPWTIPASSEKILGNI